MSPEIILTLFLTFFVNQQQVARITITMPASRQEILVHQDVAFHRIPSRPTTLIEINNKTYTRPDNPVNKFNSSQPIAQYLAPSLEFVMALPMESTLWENENDVVDIDILLFSDEFVQPLIHFKVSTLLKEMEQSNFTNRLKVYSDAMDNIVLTLYNETENSPSNSACVTHVIWSRIFYVIYVLIFIIW